MSQAILHGIWLWLLMCILVGPVFFALMSIALHYSKRAAIRFAIGTSLSDLVYATIVFATFGTFQLSGKLQWWMWVMGGLIFILMGVMLLIRTFWHQREKQWALHLRAHPHRFHFFWQGFVINAINPSVVIFWAWAVSAAAGTLWNKFDVFVMILTTLITFFSTDLLKIFLAEKLKKLAGKKTLFTIHLVTWVVLIIVGVFVLASMAHRTHFFYRFYW